LFFRPRPLFFLGPLELFVDTAKHSQETRVIFIASKNSNFSSNQIYLFVRVVSNWFSCLCFPVSRVKLNMSCVLIRVVRPIFTMGGDQLL
jgi:hypothetical protein